MNSYGDVAIAGLTVTASREKQVDLISYDLTINEIVVTGANAPALGAVEDLFSCVDRAATTRVSRR